MTHQDPKRVHPVNLVFSGDLTILVSLLTVIFSMPTHSKAVRIHIAHWNDCVDGLTRQYVEERSLVLLNVLLGFER